MSESPRYTGRTPPPAPPENGAEQEIRLGPAGPQSRIRYRALSTESKIRWLCVNPNPERKYSPLLLWVNH